MSTLSDFAAKHWVVGGIGVSLLWFVAGRQSLSNKRPDAAIFWQAVAVIIALILCGWTIAEGEWLGLAAGILVVYFEVRSIGECNGDLTPSDLVIIFGVTILGAVLHET